MHPLPLTGIASLLFGVILRGMAVALCNGRIQRYLERHAVRPAGSRYAVPELQDYRNARALAVQWRENPCFLRGWEWLNGVAALLLAAGLALLLTSAFVGVPGMSVKVLGATVPVLAIVYFLVVVNGAIAPAWKPVRPGERRWLRAVDVAAALGRAILFMAYWIQGVAFESPTIAALVFVFSWGVFGARWARPASWSRTGQKIAAMPRHQRRVLKVVVVTSMVILNFPLFWFGSKVVLNHL